MVDVDLDIHHPLTNKFSRSTAMFISCFAAFVLLTRVLRLA